MARILEKTNLFLGLDFQTAVAVYRRVLEEAASAQGAPALQMASTEGN